MNLDWKDLLEIYENTHDEDTRAQLERIIEDAPENLHRVKLKPEEVSAIEMWLENLRQMKEG